MKIPPIPQDKQLHLLAGAIASACLWHWGPWAMLVAAAWAGIVKECWDSKNPPHVEDAWDALATALGGLVPMVARLWW